MTALSTRATWWGPTFIVGAIVEWLISSAGGLLFGVVFFFPFSLGGDRVRAALPVASLRALAIHALGSDFTTLAAGATLVVGLFATGQAYRRR